MARTCSIEQKLVPQRDGKSWSQPIRASCPTGRVAPIGSSWEATVSSSQEQDDCATTRQPWQAFQNGIKSAARWLASESQGCACKHVLESELTCEWKSTVHLQAHSWEWVDLRVKVNSALASTFLRVSWLVSESHRCICKHVLERWSWLASARAAVLLVDTSKVTQEQALQVWAWNIQKQQ